MKEKIKRHSRSALSVLLAVCMLVSCMAVGIVGTEAAKTDEESVGAAVVVKGSWDNWQSHDVGSYSVTLAANTNYNFVFNDNGTQYANNVTFSSAQSEYWVTPNDNTSFTLRTSSAGSYTFTYYEISNGSLRFGISFPAASTWTVVGECGKSANTTNLFGTGWAPTSTANIMTNSNGTWTWTKNNVYLTSTDTINYKVAQNSSWDVTYPSANATKSVSTTGYYNVTVTFIENTHVVSMTLTQATLYSLSVPTVANAVVKATYGTTTAQEGGTLTNLPPSAKVSVSITPDTGYMTNTVSASGCTVTGSNNSWTVTMPSAAANSSTASKSLAVTMKTIGTKKLYFNNNASEYNMVSAYVQRSSDGYEPFGVYPGATMTKLANSDIWVIEIPEDCDKVRFTGDNGNSTGTTLLTISTAYNPPMYTAGPNKASPNSSSTWGKYYTRYNEYSVSKGSTLNNSNLFTGIKATFYDYYTDGELSGITAGSNDTSTSQGWLKGIANDEYTWTENGWKWNPYTVLNSALSNYNKNISNSATYNNTTYGLYFGNLNTWSDNGTGSAMNDSNIGRGSTSTITGYTGWNLNANNSIQLSNNHNAATGLTGLTLARGQIHHYKSGNTNQNGMDMGMFNEDFLSGWNNANKPLATILRSPSFPVYKRTQSTYPNIYFDASSCSWTFNDGDTVYAYFWNGSGNTKVSGTRSGNIITFAVPSGYEGANVLFYRSNTLNGTWHTQTPDLTVPTDSSVKYNVNNNFSGGSWGTYASATSYSHTYYEYDSTNGLDNAYITTINKTNKTAQLDYYNNSNKVHSNSNTDGFFPFNRNNLLNSSYAQDLGFGMKLEIPFTLEANGEFSDGMHQVFEFSGDDDLWVYIDDRLVLDLGGAHARTEGKIDFADRTVTANQTQQVGGSGRNSEFNWFDNTDPDAIHTMTIYYMERGMYDSNLKFGFSFHAIPNQLKTEKKIRTANINQGFFVTNTTTQSNLWIDDHQNVTWFEKAFRNDDFIITHKQGGTNITGKSYTLTSNGANSATASTSTSTTGTVTDGTYKLHNDEIAYFKGQFTSNALMTLSETDDNTGGHINQFEYDETVDVYDDANVDSENNSYRFTTVSGTPTVAGTVSGGANSGASFLFTETAPTGLENLNIRTRFTNQMQSHDLRIIKNSNVPNDETNFTVNVKFNFDNQEAGVQQGYIAYPLWCEKTAVNGTKTSVQLSTAGDVTLKPGEILLIPKVPENARVQVSETLATSSDYACTGITVYDGSGNELDFAVGASQTTSGSDVTKIQQFTVGDYDMTAQVNNEVGDPVTITHYLHPDSTGTGTLTVSAQVRTSGGSVRETYPSSGTTNTVTIPNTYIKRGSTDKIVITLNTVPDSPSTLENFYEEINSTLNVLAASGTPYTASINKANGTATITVNVAALFDSTTKVQKYTTLPFYSKLMLPTYNFNITKTTNGSTSETFNFEVYKKTGLVYEKITNDPGFTFSGTGTGTFSGGTLTLSPGKTATFTATHGEVYKVVEVPKGTSVFDYDAAGSSVSPTSGEYADEYGFADITVAANTTVTLANSRKVNAYIHKATNSDYDYSTPFKVQIQTSTDGITFNNISNSTLNVTKKYGTAQATTSTVAQVNNTFEIYKGDRIELPDLSAGTHVRVIETDYASTYYTFGGITSSDVTLTTVSGNAYAKDFVVGSTEANVTITNNFIPQTVKVTKRVYDKNGSTYTDYKYDDGSEFVIKVLYRPKGADSANYIPLTTGLVSLTGTGAAAAPVGGAANGLYTVRKDGYIQFNNIPKGSYVEVDEDSVGASPITGEERFTEQYLVNATDATNNSAANLSGTYLAVNSDLNLVQRNVVKKNYVNISKSTDSNDTTVDHTITIHIWDNGKPNHKYDGTNAHTATDELSTINYTRTPASGTATNESTTNNTITIHSGDTLSFYYPVGSYYEISEASDSLYHMETITANTDLMAKQTAAITANGVTVPTPVVNQSTGEVKFQTKDTAASVTYVNNRNEYDFTIKKTTDVNNASDEFKVKVYTKNTAADASWTPYTGALASSRGGTVAASSGEYIIHKDEVLTVSGLKANSLVKVEETDAHSPKYAFNAITGVSGTTIIASGENQGGVLINGTGKGVVVDNDVQTTNVTINKAVTGGVTGASVNFPLSVKITNEKTGDTTTTYTCGSYTLTNGTANTNVKIKGGQTLTIANVPIGATVEVEELSLTGLTPTFTFTSIDAADANITNETKTGQKVSFKTANASTAAVTVTNAIATHDVTITKDLTNSSSTQTFPMAVTISGTTKTSWTYKIGDAAQTTGALPSSMSIASGKSIVIKDVPEGASVTVTETVPTGYTCKSVVAKKSSNSDIIDSVNNSNTLTFTTPADNSIVTVTNEISNKTFTVKKVTDSGDGSGFGIKVEYKPSNSSSWVNYAGTGFTSGVVTLAHNGTASVSVPSDAQVRINETVVTSGYQFVSIANGANVSSTNPTTYAGNAIANGDTIIVNNRKLYQVTIAKNLDSSITSDPATFTFNYSYTDKDGNPVSGTSTAIGNNGTFNLPDLLPAGTQVTITENVTAGYTNTGSTTTANISKSGNVYTVNGNGTITFNNSLKEKTLRIKKTVDYSYTDETTFPITVQYWDATLATPAYVNVPDAPATISNSGAWATVTLKGVAAESKIKVTENLPASTHYLAASTTSSVANATKVTAESSGSSIVFTSTDAQNPDVTFNNVAITKSFTINKTVDVAIDSGKSFKLHVQKKAPGESTFTDFTGGSISSGVVRFIPGTAITISNQPIGTEFKIWEEFDALDSDLPTGYSFSGVTKTNMENGTGTVANGIVVKVANTTSAQSVNFTNTKSSQLIVTKSISGAPADKTFPITIQAIIGSTKTTLDSSKVKIYNSSGTEITGSDRTAKISGDVYYLKNGETVKVDAQKNDKFFVDETLTGEDAQRYQRTGITVSGGTETDDGTGKQITIGDGNANATVTNTVKTAKVNVTKQLLTGSTTSSFSINVQYKRPGESTFTTQPYSVAPNATSADLVLPVGTIVKVTETTPSGAVAGFEYDSMTRKTGSASATAYTAGAEYTLTSTDDVLFTVKNKLKTFTVTIVKEVENEAGTAIADSTDFNISVNNGGTTSTGIINKSVPKTVVLNDVPYGTNVTVSETTLPRGYVLKGITGNGTVTADKTITVTNTKLNTYSVTVTKKVTDGTPDSTKFGISVQTNSTPYTYAVNGGTATAVSTGAESTVSLANNEYVTVSGLLAGENLTVTETNENASNYAFVNFTVNGSAQAGTNKSYTYTVTNAATQTIDVNNTQLHNLKITKTTNVNNTTDNFTFKAYYKNNISDSWTAISENIQIAKGGTWTSPSKYKTGTLFKVEEVVPAKYSYNASGSSVSNSTGTAITNGFENITMGTTDVTVTANNLVNTKTVTVTKNADYTESAAGAFAFNVKTKAEGASTATNCTYPYKLNGAGTELNFTDGNVTLTSGQSIVIYNVPVDTEVTVQETNAGTATSTTAEITGAKSGSNSYNASTKTATFTVGDSSNPSVTFTNSKNKTLSISKAKPSADSDIHDSSTTFQILVKKNNVNYTGTAGTDYTAPQGVTLTNGVFTLKMGQTITLNVANGEQYEISEINIDSKYTLTDVSATGADSTVVENGKHFTIGNDNASITFTNTIKRNDVIVQKAYSTGESNSAEHTAVVTVRPNGQSSEEGKTVTTETHFKKGTDFVVQNVPAGAYVTVEETAFATGYELDNISESAFTMPNDADKTVTVTNKLQKKTVTIIKKVVDKDNNVLTDTSSFTLDVTAGGTTTHPTITQAANVTFEVDYGTAVTVAEQSKAGYKLKGISDIPATITGDTTITVTNYRLHDVTITKNVDDPSCTAYFPIKVKVDGTQITSLTGYTFAATMPTTTGGNVYFDDTNDVFMLKAGQSFTIKDIIENTTVDVLEDTTGFGYDYAYNAAGSSVTDNKGTASTSGNDKGFTGITVDKDVTVTIANKALHTVEIQKTTDKATTDTFNIQVIVGDSTNLINAANFNVALNNVTAATDRYVFNKNGKITVSGVPYGTQFRVVEINGGTEDFKFNQTDSTVTGATKTAVTNGYTFTTAHDDVSAIVNNTEAAKYRYEIKYKYKGYSATTYNNDGSDKMGADRFFVASGEFTSEEKDQYLVANGTGMTLTDDANMRMEFVSNHAPTEDNFMMDISWDSTKITNLSYNPETKTISFEINATIVPNRDVNVIFKTPYETDANVMPLNDTHTDVQQKQTTTKYGNLVKPNGSLVTAPLTLKGSGDTTYYFRYWQIKSTNQGGRNAGKVETDYKKCFYADFNLTMYQDSYVEAVYTDAQIDYNPSARSLEDTQDGEAKIGFIENSRNQWNSNGGGEGMTGNNLLAGDRLYSDFLLTFGYRDQLLKGNTAVSKAGLVLEQVRLLDEDGYGGYVTKTASEYAGEVTAEQKTAAINNAKAYISGTNLPGFVANSTVNLSQLDNKNQTKFSFNFKNKDYGTLNDGTAKNYVYRAYSYIVVNGVTVISDPVYFTIYDLASIE